MRSFSPSNPALRYMGRIDMADPDRPVLIYPYTQVAFRFSGTSLGVGLINTRAYGSSQLGYQLDGYQGKVGLPEDDREIIVPIATDLPDIEHEVALFKRQDGEHYITLTAIEVDDTARIQAPARAPETRRIEVFGDSVSCGERNEATAYTGKADPEADLSSYSNAWYSYAAITARALHAQLHNVSQGGVALVDGIGWFNGPEYIGMESMWDRLEYNPSLGACKPWDFQGYTPHVVIVAIGQNDSHPYDFMMNDYNGAQARNWRSSYASFITSLRHRYPNALIVTTTTVLQHDPAWDRAIDEVCSSLSDQRITHFLYNRNGKATPGHPRIAEHEEMAEELTKYLKGFGESIWIDA